MTEQPILLWEPGLPTCENARLTDFINWLSAHKQLTINGYDELWAWSVAHIDEFWESIWGYFDVISHTPWERVRNGASMPGVKWFEGSTLNYAEHAFRHRTDQRPALLFQSEHVPLSELSWAELEAQVAAFAAYLKAQGVGKGDCVAAFLPNIPEATVAFLAACSLGAIWSSCSPDFGASSVADRFLQIEPKVLIATDGYRYGGKPFSKREVVADIIRSLPTLEQVVWVPHLDAASSFPGTDLWADALQTPNEGLFFEPVPFGHPIWVLYSSGTTGKPKAITHGHGGVLLEHLKYLALQNDVHPGERFFWYSTTGWMMWNFVQAALLVGATPVLYDGSPGFPDLNVLWEFTERAGIHHFGTSAPYLVACMKKKVAPGQSFDLSHLRSIGSTGAPLPPEAFGYVYEQIKADVWLTSMSGGTDVCTAFVGGCPTEPVYQGEIQRRALGCALYAYDDEGKELPEGEVGEMVVTEPMPSMPVFFWKDEDGSRYRESYFEMFPGIWRHGDWVQITSRNTLVILGRSDATLNRQGIRIGTAEIYRAVDKVGGIKDSLVVNLELSGGRHFMPLFVLMEEGQELTEQVRQAIRDQLRADYTPRHVPDEIIQVEDIPYTISGKKLEAPVKKILMGRPVGKAANPGAMRNPESLQFFIRFSEQL